MDRGILLYQSLKNEPVTGRKIICFPDNQLWSGKQREERLILGDIQRFFSIILAEDYNLEACLERSLLICYNFTGTLWIQKDIFIYEKL